MTELDVLWAKWIALARKLEKSDREFCAPFFSSKPEGYDEQRHRVLLVGKATDGWYWGDKNINLTSHLSDLDLGKSQCKTNHEFRMKRANDPSRHPGFWEFKLRCAEAFGGSRPYPQNLIWSNLFKISHKTGNPKVWLAEEQRDLAVETMAAEITEYKPTLVIFVNSGYYEDIVKAATGLNRDWIPEREGRPDESWASALGGWPPMLWVRHPARKPHAVWNVWIDRALRLAGKH